MGLDMYLRLQTAEINEWTDDDTPAEGLRYLSGHAHNGAEGVAEFEAVVNGLGLGELVEPMSPGILTRGDDVQMTVMYWRKANAIHAWFVEHCQGGEDECEPSPPIHVEQLAELASRCRRVIADPSLAMDLLPPMPGFFFGSTEIDENYMADLKETATGLENVIRRTLRLPDKARYHFSYRSSW